jgi:hypothetical protein
MTTYYDFIPNRKTAPSFMPTFDGNTYTVTIIWNISAKRYYVMCKTTDGNLVFFVPLVQTMVSYEITNLVYDEQNSRVVATIADPFQLKIGQVFNANIINTAPIGYSGFGLASVLSDNEFIYNIPQNPGLPTVYGAVEILISITQAYFQSTMIFRNGRFEVNP